MNTFTCTIFSDLHYGDVDYGDFKCRSGLKKINQIISETKDTEFYINLGDFVDYLKDGKITFYEEAVAVLEQNDLEVFDGITSKKSAYKRIIYNVMGNHETAFVKKSDLKKFIPYKERVGSVYSFKHKGIFFLVLDANFNRQSKSDYFEVMHTTLEFTFPDPVIDWVKGELKSLVDGKTEGIVCLSHIAYKDIDDQSRLKVIKECKKYNLPITFFCGHAHEDLVERSLDEKGNFLADVYTLPAVTSGNTYKYYNVTFENGKVKEIDRHLNQTMILI